MTERVARPEVRFGLQFSLLQGPAVLFSQESDPFRVVRRDSCAFT